MKKNSGKFWLGKKMPLKMRQKMSDAKQGDKNPAKRLDVRKKLKKAKLGKVSGFKGRKQTEEARRKIGKEKMREKNPNWLGGKSFEPYSIDWTETLKKSIRQRDRYTCQICGKEPAVSVHHIDYNKKNCNSNNLITLCRSCHSKTNHNKKYWINYFRKSIIH